MKNIIIFILFFLISQIPVNGQERYSELTGVVLDSSGTPIQNATVFIPYSSIATITNSSGEYRLINIPDGNHEIVFRHLAFTPLTKAISFISKNSINLNVKLSTSIIELNEIVKKASPSDWKIGLVKFQEYVIGDSAGSNCKVINPRDLYFYNDDDQLHGYATNPIEIVNNYLGYKLIYYLDHFWYNEIDKNYKNSGVQYSFSGSAYYIDLSNDSPNKAKIWKKNRKKEYKGTLRHFFQSAFHDSIIEQGFVIKETWNNLEDFQNFLNSNQTIAYAKWLLTDRLFYWDKRSKKTTYQHYLLDQDYILQLVGNKSDQIDSSKEILLTHNSLIFHYWDIGHQFKDARVSFLKIIPDEINEQPKLFVDQFGNYQIEKGKLLWEYLDNHMKLRVSLPMNYFDAWTEK